MAKRDLFDRTCMNCLTRLSSFEDCQEVEFSCGEALSNSELSYWEVKNNPDKLPADMRSFYEMFNGIKAPWYVQLGERRINIGCMSINSLDKILRYSMENVNKTHWKNKFPSISDEKQIFAYLLDSIPDIGDVVIVFTRQNEILLNCHPSNPDSKETLQVHVIFIDVSNNAHYICSSFSNYLRLMVVHFGIYGWQYAFSPEGLPPATKEWMGLFCKERLCVDLSSFKTDVLGENAEL